MESKDLIEHFFVQERAGRKKLLFAIWGIVILTDVFVLIAYLQGMDIYRILQFLTVPLVLAVVVQWRSSHRTKTLQRRLGALLDSIEFGWEELNGLDLDQRKQTISIRPLQRATSVESPPTSPICAPVAAMRRDQPLTRQKRALTQISYE